MENEVFFPDECFRWPCRVEQGGAELSHSKQMNYIFIYVFSLEIVIVSVTTLK